MDSWVNKMMQNEQVIYINQFQEKVKGEEKKTGNQRRAWNEDEAHDEFN